MTFLKQILQSDLFQRKNTILFFFLALINIACFLVTDLHMKVGNRETFFLILNGHSCHCSTHKSNARDEENIIS
jgi:hypothetical protein